MACRKVADYGRVGAVKPSSNQCNKKQQSLELMEAGLFDFWGGCWTCRWIDYTGTTTATTTTSSKKVKCSVGSMERDLCIVCVCMYRRDKDRKKKVTALLALGPRMNRKEPVAYVVLWRAGSECV